MVPWAGYFRGSGVMGIGLLSRVKLAVVRVVRQLWAVVLVGDGIHMVWQFRQFCLVGLAFCP